MGETALPLGDQGEVELVGHELVPSRQRTGL